MEGMFDCFPKSEKVLNQCCKSFAEHIFKRGEVLSSAQIIQVLNMKPWHRLLEASAKRLKFRCVRQFHGRKEWKTCCVYFLGNLEKRDSYWNGLRRNITGTHSCNENKQVGLENFVCATSAKKGAQK